MNMNKTLFAFVILFEQFVNTGRDNKHKLIYQKDVSEHCRRRVFPSIFLGRQVVNANSQILQFSRLELPYSCYISIRTESGSNMIMVIQLASDDLKKSCTKNSEQLLVYEMGETFGRYWGPLPDSVMRRNPPDPTVYTLKTTTPTERTTTSLGDLPEESESSSYQKVLKYSTKSMETSEQSRDFIELEVPLVNVSVKLLPGNEQPLKPLDKELDFDQRNDVTPIPGVSYETSILPLVQFSIRHHGERRLGDDAAPKYDLDIVEEFTPDIRFTWPQINPTTSRRRKSYQKQKYEATRRLNFKKHQTLINTEKYINRQVVTRVFTKYKFPIKKTIEKERSTNSLDSWLALEDLLKKLNKTKENTDATISEDDVNFFEKMSNLEQNVSVYLMSNLSKYKSDYKNTIRRWETTTLANSLKTEHYNYEKPVTSTKMTTEALQDITSNQSFYIIVPETNNIELVTKSLDVTDAKKDRDIVVLSFNESTSNRLKENNATFNNTAESFAKVFDIESKIQPAKETTIGYKMDIKMVTGSMVGHESWENVVQAAPEMAVKLNQIVPYSRSSSNINHDVTKDSNETRHKDTLLKRKKKDIHSISIKDAWPHNLTKKGERATTSQSMFDVADMQEFAQLVELQDDELHGRVALRYLRQYVGPALYNLCDLAESTKRHVHLFNSSRIVLIISNFTLDRMIIILTAARALLSRETRCPKSQLECQVSGASVCLDSMVACDGVPNCGSYDIYDEDRLLCGASVGLQHNVYLAAFTFLAVLLTALYAVHYWLKRCVPKVADAFFVYTNGIENVLYLESIMRSPNDVDDVSKMVYHDNFLGDDHFYEDLKISDTNTYKRFLRAFCFCFRKKSPKKDAKESTDLETSSQMQQRQLNSFSDVVVHKMYTPLKDTSVQTGDSLEMKYLEKDKQKGTLGPSSAKPMSETSGCSSTMPTVSPIMINDSLFTLEEPLPERHTDELGLLKFYRAGRKNNSLQSDSNEEIYEDTKTQDIKRDLRSELVINSYNYDQYGETEPGPSRRTQPKTSAPYCSVQKQLRFDEVTTSIPPVEYDDDEDDNDGSIRCRSIALGEPEYRRVTPHLERIDEDNEPNVVGKEHLHFWGGSKFKKPKKKTHVARH